MGWHRAQPEEMRVQSDKAENDAECCNEYLHFDSFSASSRFRRPARCSKNCELFGKNSPFSAESPLFSRVSSGEVGTLGENHALRRAKMRGGKSWRAEKKTVSLRRYAAHATFLLRRPAVSHSACSPSARAGTRPATAWALLRAPRVAPSTPTFHSIFPPLQQQFSC